MINSTYNNHENFTTFSTFSLMTVSALILTFWSLNLQKQGEFSTTMFDFKISTEGPVLLPKVEKVRGLVGPDQETILIKPAMAGLPA